MDAKYNINIIIQNNLFISLTPIVLYSVKDNSLFQKCPKKLQKTLF